MKYSVTAAEAQKMLKKIMEEKANILEDERQTCMFNASLTENPDDVRPKYDYRATREAVALCDKKIRMLKHEINRFNMRQVIGADNMTIDQALVYIPQLSDERNRLRGLQSKLPKQRASIAGTGSNTFVDYRYANYNIEEAKEDYLRVSDELRALQTALDTANTTVKMEFELPD